MNVLLGLFCLMLLLSNTLAFLKKFWAGKKYALWVQTVYFPQKCFSCSLSAEYHTALLHHQLHLPWVKQSAFPAKRRFHRQRKLKDLVAGNSKAKETIRSLTLIPRCYSIYHILATSEGGTGLAEVESKINFQKWKWHKVFSF